jgi:DNA-binding NtrC family response regulator
MGESKLNLLLVDDDEDDYSITSDKLGEIKGLHFETTWVTTYEAAVEALTKKSFTLCITDYNLQRLKTGVDLVEEMKQKGCIVPFIVLTGQGTLSLCIEAGKRGAVDFLDKGSVTPGQLSQAIDRALRVARTSDKLKQTEEQLRRVAEKR